jgi:hypothetical protein
MFLQFVFSVFIANYIVHRYINIFISIYLLTGNIIEKNEISLSSYDQKILIAD